MEKNFYRNAKFLTSAAKVFQLPEDTGYEVAFAGRSNAGKSSAINCITEQTRLARASKTPGRTQLINLFELDEARRLVDLPGFGYAKVSQAIQKAWQRELDGYLRGRQCLRGVVQVMDIRHPLKPFDLDMIAWATQNQIPIHLLLTKADKLSRGAAMQVVHKTKKALVSTGDLVTVQCFSSQSKLGLEECWIKLDEWFEIQLVNEE